MLLASDPGLEIDGADHPDGRMTAAPVVDNLKPASHSLPCFITGGPFLPVIKLGL